MRTGRSYKPYVANRCLKDWEGLRPTLTQDFFQQALRHRRLGERSYLDQPKPLFVFIKRFWRPSLEQPRNEPFDLEEGLTLIQEDTAPTRKTLAGCGGAPARVVRAGIPQKARPR